MGKETVSVSIDDYLYDIVRSQDDLNFSGLVNRLVRDYLEVRDEDRAVLKTRIHLLENEEKELQERLDSVLEARTFLEERLDKLSTRGDAEDILRNFAMKVHAGETLSEENYSFLAKDLGLSREEIDKRIKELVSEIERDTGREMYNSKENAVRTVARAISRGKDPSPSERWVILQAERADLPVGVLINKAERLAEGGAVVE